MKIQNNTNFLNERLRIVGGNLTSIWDKNTFFIGTSPYPLPRINYITSTLVDISPLVYKNKLNIQYHLSGYGSNSSESRISFLGESSERYSFAMMPITLRKDIVKASYNSLCAKYGDKHVLPLKYINIFGKLDGIDIVSPLDEITWVKTRSILNPQSIIFQPLQFIMFDTNKFDKKYNVSAVSTGTASHESVENALRNAIIEDLQIDSYNLWWYGGHTGHKLKVNLASIIRNYLNSDFQQFMDNYHVTFTDISFDKSLWIIVCEIEGINSRPLYTVGLQGSMSLDKAIYRSFMEALTVMAYSINMSWLKPKILQKSKANLGHIRDLDQNVANYAMNSKPELRVNNHNLALSNKKAKNISELIAYNSDFLEWAGVINITPHEFKNLNLNVIRVFTPKLLPVAMPSFPPVSHPRYQETGGVINYYEHPMA